MSFVCLYHACGHYHWTCIPTERALDIRRETLARPCDACRPAYRYWPC